MRHWSESTELHILNKAVVELKRRVEWAFHFCLEEEADHAHDDLLRAEWRLRQAMRQGRA